MISECLKDIDKPTDIEKYYSQESPNKNPALLICKDKLEKQNKEISNYNLNIYNINSNSGSMGTYNRYNYDMCNETINHRLYTDNKNNRENNNLVYDYDIKTSNILPQPMEFNNYNKNINVESDLQGINYYGDNCFNDNYKINHNHESFNKFVKVYDKLQERNNNMKLKQKSLHKLENQNNCINKFQKFDLCDKNKVKYPIGLYTEDNMPVNYRFSNQQYCEGFECQKLFNNVTKRNMVSRINLQ